MLKFYSPGKLLITAEYLVLSGAKAFALPTQKGQHMQVTPLETPVLKWKSYTHTQEVWMDVTLSLDTFDCLVDNKTPLSLIKKLQDILKCVRSLQPTFCSTGFEVQTNLDFDRSWGLGSSSTFINNIAQWAQVNPYELLDKTFGGSGYDVAVAEAKQAIFFTRNQYTPLVELLSYNPSFKDQLYFVHLNEKQDSQQEVAAYNKRTKPSNKQIESINELTSSLLKTSTLTRFNELIVTHEKIIGSLLQQTPIKERLFPDFNGAIKSLGAWGGDFILATGDSCPTYFKEKGYATVIRYDEMIA
ncbi:GYDIA family GHMP kinase [Flavobacteriaceae bacterium]|nr:GYDIA family GHMP kinase [Flavobacteriaceae bacterium]